MSFKAILFFQEEERQLLNAELIFYQLADYNGRPKQSPVGEPLQLVFESTRNDEIFYSYMFHPDRMCKGYIRFFKRDGFQKYFDIEFANAHIIKLREHFSSTGENPMTMQLSLSYGISRIRDLIHEKKWNPNNPFITQNTPIIKDKEPRILSCRYTNLEGHDIEELHEDTLILEVRTENCVGKLVDIDLSDDEYNFKYQGAHLKHDLIENLLITSDLQQVELDIFEEED
ncbi:type VI secretion system tube protein TssD [Pseudotamlana agarivorans]|uniref:type VI secretion system tube protein TssD n=1 Tax=Pseudotamlana agarivorans TaxID=481183 RepID=UPI00082FFA84|nr:type VI secretion system tube protein TssD [Tamlana agarivorans]